VLLLLLLGSLRRVRQLLQAARAGSRHLLLLTKASWPLAVALGTLLLVVLPGLLTPLSDSDGLRYHVALPKLFLLEGRIGFYAWDVTGGYPQTAEMLYLLGLKLAPGEVAKTIHLLFFCAALATSALLIHSGRRTREAALAAPWFLAAAPVALIPAAAGFIDHIALLHIVAALLLIRRRAPAWLVGVVLAAAAATKVTSGPAVAVLVLYCIVTASRGARLRTALATTVPALVAWLPFLVRNLISTGDPVFPFGHILLGRPIPGIAPELRAWAVHFHADVPGFLGIPWGTSMAASFPDEVVGWHLLAGLIVLPLVLADRKTRPLALVVAAYAPLGFFAQPPTRLLLPALAALALAAAIALGRLPRRAVIALGLVAALPAAVEASGLLLRDGRTFRLLSGTLSRDAFLTARVPGFSASAFIAGQAPGGRVMALDFPAPYYLNRPWVAEGLLNEPPLRLWLAAGESADTIVGRLTALDIRYVIVTPRFGGGTTHTLLPLARSPAELATVAALRGRMTLLVSLGGVDVLRFNPTPASQGTSHTTRPTPTSL
jgi:hypothetical protein